jgi:hypothetical protein
MTDGMNAEGECRRDHRDSSSHGGWKAPQLVLILQNAALLQGSGRKPEQSRSIVSIRSPATTQDVCCSHLYPAVLMHTKPVSDAYRIEEWLYNEIYQLKGICLAEPLPKVTRRLDTGGCLTET